MFKGINWLFFLDLWFGCFFEILWYVVWKNLYVKKNVFYWLIFSFNGLINKLIFDKFYGINDD